MRFYSIVKPSNPFVDSLKCSRLSLGKSDLTQDEAIETLTHLFRNHDGRLKVADRFVFSNTGLYVTWTFNVSFKDNYAKERLDHTYCLLSFGEAWDVYCQRIKDEDAVTVSEIKYEFVQAPSDSWSLHITECLHDADWVIR